VKHIIQFFYILLFGFDGAWLFLSTVLALQGCRNAKTFVLMPGRIPEWDQLAVKIQLVYLF
jgi:hypothetical protein